MARNFKTTQHITCPDEDSVNCLEDYVLNFEESKLVEAFERYPGPSKEGGGHIDTKELVHDARKKTMYCESDKLRGTRFCVITGTGDKVRNNNQQAHRIYGLGNKNS